MNGTLQARGVFLEDIMIKFLLWAAIWGSENGKLSSGSPIGSEFNAVKMEIWQAVQPQEANLWRWNGNLGISPMGIWRWKWKFGQRYAYSKRICGSENGNLGSGSPTRIQFEAVKIEVVISVASEAWSGVVGWKNLVFVRPSVCVSVWWNFSRDWPVRLTCGLFISCRKCSEECS
jgi:hypothetical protein